MLEFFGYYTLLFVSILSWRRSVRYNQMFSITKIQLTFSMIKKKNLTLG